MDNKTNAFRAYQHLRDKLLDGDVQPGERLLYGPIGKEIGVSATPVREAAGQLANEGLVDLVPQMGAIVRRLDRNELIEIYEVRLAIEPFAAKLAADRATLEQISEIEQSLTLMRELTQQHIQSGNEIADKEISRKFDKADFAFHTGVIEATGNSAMIRTAGQSHVLTRVFGIRRHKYDQNAMTFTCDDHEAILNSIKNSDQQTAYNAAASHIESGLKISLAAIDDKISDE